jgi:hypothetical protein
MICCLSARVQESGPTLIPGSPYSKEMESAGAKMVELERAERSYWFHQSVLLSIILPMALLQTGQKLLMLFDFIVQSWYGR